MKLRSQDWVIYCWGYYELNKKKHVGRISEVHRDYAEIFSEEHKLHTIPLKDILISARTKNSLIRKIADETITC
jgi:hypothetical protein